MCDILNFPSRINNAFALEPLFITKCSVKGIDDIIEA